MTELQDKEARRTRVIALVALGLALLCTAAIVAHVIHDALAFGEVWGRIGGR